MRRYALKFGYFGKDFHGFQRQPDVKTVEGDILDAMKRTGIVKDYKIAGFQSASRTDRGVSALGNVLGVNTDFRKTEILPALNANLENIWFFGLSEVDSGFTPRHAINRIYRYYLMSDNLNLNKIRSASSKFIGTHDFKSFCYSVKGKNTARTVNRIDVLEKNGFVIIEVEAPNFLWGMVRMMVSAMLKVDQGVITVKDIETALKDERKRDFGIAPPHPLILFDVTYDFKFELLREFKKDAALKCIDNIKKELFFSQVNDIFYQEMSKKF